MIAIIDYNVGNLHNLKNAMDYQQLPARIVTRPEEVAQADRIILPGVGAFRPAMDHLRQAEMIHVVRERVADGVPFLGVCVGMQLLLETSEEDGEHEGLGLIQGRIVRFQGGPGLKVPQIGWNQVTWQGDDPLNRDIADGTYFYFVHSYHAQVTRPEDALGLTKYGVMFPAVVRHSNVWGVQFHPEKSQNAGLQLLKNFATMQPA